MVLATARRSADSFLADNNSLCCRFTRELQNLKKMADYSSRDAGNLNAFLQSIGAEFSIYTYSMLNAGVDKESIRSLSEEQLVNECGITNSIHRLRILESITRESKLQIS